MGWKSALLPLLMAAVVPTLAQTASPAPQSEISQNQPANAQEDDGPLTTIHAQVQEVNVIFTATDRRGHYRKDLKPADLAVLDDGKPPARVNSFVSETDLPLRVGLVMDVSGSITSRMAFEQESAIKFFNQILRPNTDKAFILAFDSVQRTPQDFTDDPAKLAAGVRSLTPGGGTALYDAIATAATKKLRAVKSDRPIRRVIILISDGEDNQSRVTRAEAIEAARRGEVTVYAISTNDSNVKSRGDKLLEQLADETGGRAFFPNKVEDVMHAFNTIQDELRSQYAVSYKPADFDADGHYRSILIMARTDKNVVIRARKGYFAPSR
jgi:Ca-activated chloride channel family protein